MEIKKMVKRIFAIGAGATMLGATVMGAMAADLKNYPDMFVDDGVFNGLLVVGEKAAAVDNLALTDIASSMMYMKSDVSTVSVEGDAWKVEAGGDELEFGEAVGPAASGVVDFLDEDDLGALATGQLKSSKGTFS
ncbi:MAG: S-layer protein, partial [Nanoarchaeota archaeon]